MSDWALVGDVGGTNARFALVHPGSVELHHIKVLPCAEFDNLDGAVRAYLQQVGVTVQEACIAFACPVHGDEVKMTNNHWRFSKSSMQVSLGLQTLKCINDFTAMALGMPQVPDSDVIAVGSGESLHGRPRLVIGPGTGLGVSALVSNGNDWIPLAAEGGHVNWAPTSEWEIQLWLHFKKHFSRISAERLLSGAGLLLLYQGYCALRGLEERCATPADVTNGALQDGDELCLEVLNHFCGILGEVAGDAALTIGALGGVYICGGIVPRFPELFLGSPFRQQFEEKGRFKDYMKAIPVWLVNAEYPGLLGAAAGLANAAVH